MAFIKHGSPEKLELINDATVDTVVCRKCGSVLIRATGNASITISGEGAMISCNKCGEVTHGV